MSTVYVSIGNSDDKLTQAEWAAYYREVNLTARKWADGVHGQWVSEPASAWQNACWCVEVDENRAGDLRDDLAHLAHRYRQDSIAWAETPVTEFLS